MSISFGISLGVFFALTVPDIYKIIRNPPSPRIIQSSGPFPGDGDDAGPHIVEPLVPPTLSVPTSIPTQSWPEHSFQGESITIECDDPLVILLAKRRKGLIIGPSSACADFSRVFSGLDDDARYRAIVRPLASQCDPGYWADEDFRERVLLKKLPINIQSDGEAIFEVDLAPLEVTLAPRRNDVVALVARSFERISMHGGLVHGRCSDPQVDGRSDASQFGIICGKDVRKYNVTSRPEFVTSLTALAGTGEENRLCCPCPNVSSVTIHILLLDKSDVLQQPAVIFQRLLTGGVKCGDGRTRSMPESVTELLGRDDQKEIVSDDIGALSDASWARLANGGPAPQATIKCLPCVGH